MTLFRVIYKLILAQNFDFVKVIYLLTKSKKYANIYIENKINSSLFCLSATKPVIPPNWEVVAIQG